MPRRRRPDRLTGLQVQNHQGRAGGRGPFEPRLGLVFPQGSQGQASGSCLTVTARLDVGMGTRSLALF